MKNLNYTKFVSLQIFQTLFIRFILIKFRIVQRYLAFGIFPNAERIKFIINLIIFSSLHKNIMKKNVFIFYYMIFFRVINATLVSFYLIFSFVLDFLVRKFNTRYTIYIRVFQQMKIISICDFWGGGYQNSSCSLKINQIKL